MSCCSDRTCSSPGDSAFAPDPARAPDVRAARRSLHRAAVLADDHPRRRRDPRRRGRSGTADPIEPCPTRLAVLHELAARPRGSPRWSRPPARGAMDVDELVGRLGVGREQVARALDALVAAGHCCARSATSRRVVVAAEAFDGRGRRAARRSPPVPSGRSAGEGDRPRGSRGPGAARRVAAGLPRRARSPRPRPRQLALDQDLVHASRTVTRCATTSADRATSSKIGSAPLGLQAPSADDVIRELQLERDAGEEDPAAAGRRKRAS